MSPGVRTLKRGFDTNLRTHEPGNGKKHKRCITCRITAEWSVSQTGRVGATVNPIFHDGMYEVGTAHYGSYEL